jgi:tRNA threonylcarbamoyladenosine biosynthesis protein TsaB
MAFFGSGEVRAPFFDGHRNEVYCGLYDANLEPLSQETVQPLTRFLATLPPAAELLTPDPAPYLLQLGDWKPPVTPRALAGVIGKLAANRLQDPATLDANYVRRSDAELNWKVEA